MKAVIEKTVTNKYKGLNEAEIKINAAELRDPSYNPLDAAKHRAAESDMIAKQAARQKALYDKYKDLLDGVNEADDELDYLFQHLVPPSGAADTVAGELIRAIMKIMYRDYNDGDLFYDGYGIDTCGSAVAYIIDTLGDDYEYLFHSIAEKELTGDDYTKALEEIADRIVFEIIDTVELIDTPNDDDMYNHEYDYDWAPKYEDEYTLEGTRLHDLIWKGALSIDDVADELSNWEEFRDCEVEPYGRYSIYISGMSTDTYNEIERSWGRWMDKLAEDAEEVFDIEIDEDDEDDDDFDSDDDIDESLRYKSSQRMSEKLTRGNRSDFIDAIRTASDLNKLLSLVDEVYWFDKDLGKKLKTVKMSDADTVSDFKASLIKVIDPDEGNLGEGYEFMYQPMNERVHGLGIEVLQNDDRDITRVHIGNSSLNSAEEVDDIIQALQKTKQYFNEASIPAQDDDIKNVTEDMDRGDFDGIEDKDFSGFDDIDNIKIIHEEDMPQSRFLEVQEAVAKQASMQDNSEKTQEDTEDIAQGMNEADFDDCDDIDVV